MEDIQSLRRFNLQSLNIISGLDEDNFILIMKRIGLIRDNILCETCGNYMHLQKRRNGSSCYVCYKRVCRASGSRKQLSIYSGSFFDNCKVGVRKKLQFVYLYLFQYGTVLNMCMEVSVNRLTCLHWGQCIRNVFRGYLRKCNFKVGGLNINVQIGETCLHKHKYNGGRFTPRNKKWLWGCLDMSTKRFLCFLVNQRNAITLEALIRSYIEPGSIITSDRKYEGIQRMKGNYHHLTINRRRNFIHPCTGANTQSIESLWARLKKFLRRKVVQSASDEKVYDYIYEFIWREEYGNSEEIVYNFFKHYDETK